MSDELSPTREVCEGCGAVAEGAEFRSGDEASYNPARMSWGARWSAPPPGWLTAFDAGGEHWVCSVACARKVDTSERARQVKDEDGPGWAVFWERKLGSPVYHAFMRGPATYGGPLGGSHGRASRIPKCHQFTRKLSDGWFVWMGEKPPGDLCPSCATIMGVPEPAKRARSA